MRSRDASLSEGWGQIVTPLSIETKGGKQKVNCADVQGTLRIIQSIPSRKAENAEGYDKNEVAAKKGGSIARGARIQLEEQTRQRVVSPENFLPEGGQKKLKRLK